MRADLAAVLAVLQPRADAVGAGLLLVGAAARDLLLTTPPPRETNDVDFGLAVASPEDVITVTAGLEKYPGHTNKFVVAGAEVDIVPFGAVEGSDQTVRSEGGFLMNVLGYREALAGAVEVGLPGGGGVRVASLAAQVVLKLTAWDDRRLLTRKDATDLLALLGEYREPSYVDEMFNAHAHRMERHDFDPGLAAADRVGAEAAALLGTGATPLVALLGRECADDGTLAADMGPAVAANRALLRALLLGMAAE